MAVDTNDLGQSPKSLPAKPVLVLDDAVTSDSNGHSSGTAKSRIIGKAKHALSERSIGMRKFSHELSEHELSHVPKVAIMMSMGSDDKAPQVQVPDSVEVCAEADLQFYGKPRKLMIFSLREFLMEGPEQEVQEERVAVKPCSHPPDVKTATEQEVQEERVAVKLEKLRYILDKEYHKRRANDGPWMWPLHNMRTNAKILAMDALEFAEEDVRLSKLRRLAHWLHILIPYGGAPIVHTIQNRFGCSAGYLFSWAYFYLSRLWILTAMIVLSELILEPIIQEDDKTGFRWEIMKGVLLVWAVFLSWSSTNRERFVPEVGKDDDFHAPGGLFHEHSIKNPRWRRRKQSDFIWRHFKFIFVVIPAFALFILTVTLILWMVVSFNIWLAFGWGDCVQLGCYDPQEKYGFVGWLAEVGSDVALAIVFEGLLALSQLLGAIAADLHNYEREADFNSALLTYSILLEAVGKIVPYTIVAFNFVPQWAEPSETKDADCSNLLGLGPAIFGDASMTCLVRRLDLKTRRIALERSMKGPFIVAPFIAILIKVIIPPVAEGLDLCARRTKCGCSCCDRVSDALFHLLALIFTDDGDSVNCLQYVVSGWPFSNMVVKSDPDDVQKLQIQERQLHSALQQAVRKPFEPLDELLELKLNFLWVLFFAPLKPIGVIFTLIARLLEVRSKLVKMLFVRRRVFPCRNRTSTMHATQYYFVRYTTIFALVWYVAISVLTYNDNLHKWVN